MAAQHKMVDDGSGEVKVRITSVLLCSTQPLHKEDPSADFETSWMNEILRQASGGFGLSRQLRVLNCPTLPSTVPPALQKKPHTHLKFLEPFDCLYSTLLGRSGELKTWSWCQWRAGGLGIFIVGTVTSFCTSMKSTARFITSSMFGRWASGSRHGNWSLVKGNGEMLNNCTGFQAQPV